MVSSIPGSVWIRITFDADTDPDSSFSDWCRSGSDFSFICEFEFRHTGGCQICHLKASFPWKSKRVKNYGRLTVCLDSPSAAFAMHVFLQFFWPTECSGSVRLLCFWIRIRILNYLYGSGCKSEIFHQRTKNCDKPWFLLFYDFSMRCYLWRLMLMYVYLQKEISKKNLHWRSQKSWKLKMSDNVIANLKN